MAANPDRPEGHFALGVACVEQGRDEEALDAFLVAHARDPDYEPTLYNIGYTYLRLDEAEQAVPWLERALRREPKKPATCTGWAWLTSGWAGEMRRWPGGGALWR
jgi:tetratricopeptide (TPR) repeat protein